MKTTVSVLLVIVGVIHLLPVTGVLGADRLATLYGMDFTDPNLEILMRHRAVLFGLLGGFLIYAAFAPPIQSLAIVAGLASVVSFLWLARPVADINEALTRVVYADWLALVCLLLAAGLLARLRLSG